MHFRQRGFCKYLRGAAYGGPSRPNPIMGKMMGSVVRIYLVWTFFFFIVRVFSCGTFQVSMRHTHVKLV